jgi:ankyrin repeat protein
VNSTRNNTAVVAMHSPVYFWQAAERGDLAVVQKIFDKGGTAIVKSINEEGRTALHFACANNHEKVVAYLSCYCNADVQVTDYEGWTPLLLACQNGHLRIVQYLVEQCRAKVKVATNKNKCTALHLARTHGHVEAAQYLVGKGLRVSTQDALGMNALHYACQNGHVELVQILCSTHNSRFRRDAASAAIPWIDDLTPKGCTALGLACEKGHMTIVSYLVEHCHASVEATSQENNWRPLHGAAYNGHLGIVQFLVEQGRAVVGAVSSQGWTALHLACRKGHAALVQYLVNYQVSLTTDFLLVATTSDHVLGPKGSTLLHLACSAPATCEDHCAMVRCLLACDRALLEATNARAERPLHLACDRASLELVLLLVEGYRANAQAQDLIGETPLIKAQAKHHGDIVTYLQGLDTTADRPAPESGPPVQDTPTASYIESSFCSCQWTLSVPPIPQGIGDPDWCPSLALTPFLLSFDDSSGVPPSVVAPCLNFGCLPRRIWSTFSSSFFPIATSPCSLSFSCCSFLSPIPF